MGAGVQLSVDDDELAHALRTLPVPEHGSGFWTALGARLGDENGAVRRAHGAHSRRRRHLLAAAVAVAVAAGLAAVSYGALLVWGVAGL